MEKAIFIHGGLIFRKEQPVQKSLLLFDKVLTDNTLVTEMIGVKNKSFDYWDEYHFDDPKKHTDSIERMLSKGVVKQSFVSQDFDRNTVSMLIDYVHNTELYMNNLRGYYRELLLSYEKEYDITLWSDELILETKDRKKTTSQLSFLMEKLPILTNDIDIDHLIDFKSDPDSKLKLAALRDWMVEISKKDYTQNEIEDKFEYLYMQYIDHMDRAKLKYDLGAGEFWITAVPEILDDLAHFKLGSTAKALFKIIKKDIHIREEERKAPGKELAFVYKANSELRK